MEMKACLLTALALYAFAALATKTNLNERIKDIRASPSAQVSQEEIGFDLEHEPFIVFTLSGTAEIAVRGLGGSTKNIHPQGNGVDDFHYIQEMWLEDENKNVIWWQELKKGKHKEPRLSFKIPNGVKTLTPVCLCYIHGVIDGPTYNVEWELSVMRLMKSLKNDEKTGPQSFHQGTHDSPVKHEPYMILDTQPYNTNSHKHTLSVGVLGEGAAQDKHPQTPAHFVKTIFVKDKHDVVVHYQEFDGSEKEPAKINKVQLPVRSRWVQAYEYCNLHGLWVTPILEIAQPDDEARNAPVVSDEEILRAHQEI